jgi:hypothetical protein
MERRGGSRHDQVSLQHHDFSRLVACCAPAVHGSTLQRHDFSPLIALCANNSTVQADAASNTTTFSPLVALPSSECGTYHPPTPRLFSTRCACTIELRPDQIIPPTPRPFPPLVAWMTSSNGPRSSNTTTFSPLVACRQRRGRRRLPVLLQRHDLSPLRCALAMHRTIAVGEDLQTPRLFSTRCAVSTQKRSKVPTVLQHHDPFSTRCAPCTTNSDLSRSASNTTTFSPLVARCARNAEDDAHKILQHHDLFSTRCAVGSADLLTSNEVLQHHDLFSTRCASRRANVTIPYTCKPFCERATFLALLSACRPPPARAQLLAPRPPSGVAVQAGRRCL